MKIKLQQLNITQLAILKYGLEEYIKNWEMNLEICKKYNMNTNIEHTEEELATGKALALAIKHGEVIIASYQYTGGDEEVSITKTE